MPVSHLETTIWTASSNPLPSASLPIRDILFPLPISGRNPAECGHSWQNVRTTAPGLRGQFGPFSVSLGPLSLKQPNHGHFGTDVETSIIQLVGGCPKGVGFEKTPLRRSEQGSNRSIRYGSSACAPRARWAFFEPLLIPISCRRPPMSASLRPSAASRPRQLDDVKCEAGGRWGRRSSSWGEPKNASSFHGLFGRDTGAL
jgi:hypothetical protein